MNLRQLEIFNAVMQAGTLTAAARTLNISQPAVSKLLHHAEDQLGIPLFTRIGGRLRPTAEALALFPEVERVFGQIRVVRQMTSDLRKNVWGRISFAAPVTMSTTVVSTAIAKFRAVQPEVAFTVHALPNRQIVDMVVNGEAEAGLVVAPFDHSLTACREIHQAELVCIMLPDHELASLDTVTPRDLRGLPLITGYGAHRFGAQLDAAFSSAGEILDVLIQVTNSIIACRLVANGAGIALSDPFATKTYFPDLVMRRFRPQVQINPRVIHRTDRPLSQITTAFAECLSAEIASLTRSADDGD